MTSKNNNYYVTTAIPFVNSSPHVGFALEIVQADTIARYQHFKGKNSFFLTGTDENSLKNVQAAEALGITPAELCKRNSQKFEDLKQALNLCNNRFIRTTHPSHFSGAQKLWNMCRKEDIYKKHYKGYYCVGCETFYTEKDLVEGLCPEHKTRPDIIEEENYFFRLSSYQNKLEQLIESDQLKIVPVSRKNEVLSFIRMGLEDFSISRSSQRAKNWGIPVPGDNSQVLYVWFDALSNYLTGLGFTGDDCQPFGNESLLDQFWPCDTHVIGKGIIRFHAVYWPAMLLSCGIPLPKSIFVHGYMTINNEKISKSLGNVIDPFSLAEKYGTDPLRYYLMRMIPPYADGDFSTEVFEKTYNADLANDLGNLLNRSLAMCRQNFGDKLPAPEPAQMQTDHERDLEATFNAALADMDRAMDEFRFNQALEAVWSLVRAGNKYIDLTEPWKLSKTVKTSDNETEVKQARSRLASVMYTLIEALGKIALLISPFIPETSLKIREAIGLGPADRVQPELKWGFIRPGTQLGEPKPIFPRLDTFKKGDSNKNSRPEKQNKQKQNQAPQKQQNEKKDNQKKEKKMNDNNAKDNNAHSFASYDQFVNMQLTAATITHVEPMEKADKLYKVTVNMGTETRVLASGLRPFFTPEEMIGKRVIVVANLEPRKIRGHLSKGMILASQVGDRLCLAGVDDFIPDGTPIS
jgi:methionyl-tRNA synthetase